jgi:hypothetical protein
MFKRPFISKRIDEMEQIFKSSGTELLTLTHKSLSKTNVDGIEPLQTLAFILICVALLADY